MNALEIILLQECIRNHFTIGMHQKSFYYRNVITYHISRNAFLRVIHFDIQECSWKIDFTLKECIENHFTIGMHWKSFYYRNALEIILLQECIGNHFTIGMHQKSTFMVSGMHTSTQSFLRVQECIKNHFTIGMHWKSFYYRNALEIILLIGMHWKSFYYRNALEIILLQECIGNLLLLQDLCSGNHFTDRNALENNFTIGMQLAESFYYRNALEIILLYEYIGNHFIIVQCIGNHFTIGMHWKSFYYEECIGNHFTIGKCI